MNPLIMWRYQNIQDFTTFIFLLGKEKIVNSTIKIKTFLSYVMSFLDHFSMRRDEMESIFRRANYFKLKKL